LFGTAHQNSIMAHQGVHKSFAMGEKNLKDLR